ncbi:MAG: NAD(P)H-dependent oxidoreductase subunit E [Halanaeroarchaeum sp.]
MASLDSIRQSVRGSDADVGGDDSGIIPAEAGVEDVCEEEVATVRSRVAPHAGDESGIIPSLQAVQDEYGYLPRFALQVIADECDTTIARVYGTASFYSQFYFEPRGEHAIKVCTGTACHVKGADDISENFQDELGVDTDEVTDDGQFTIEHVRCVGACGLAPVVVVDDNVHGPIEPGNGTELLDEYTDEEA